MARIPELVTGRLKLRPFTLQDAPVVAELCGDWEIAATTAAIPHPYDESMAVAWIESHQSAFDEGEATSWAITTLDDGGLVGAIGSHVDQGNRRAEIGYWIGKPFWNRGYATEAAQAVIAYGFGQMALNRIQARHMTKNPASGRVMQKAGLTLEGTLRQWMYRWGSFEDVVIYSILRQEHHAFEGE